jgi:hypothetical protein
MGAALGSIIAVIMIHHMRNMRSAYSGVQSMDGMDMPRPDIR